AESDLRKCAEEFQAVIVAALKEQADLEVQNAAIKARATKGLSPKTIPIERSKYYLLKDLSTGEDKKNKKQEPGPFYFSPDEVGHYLTGVYKEYYDGLRGRIEKMQAALPPEYPYYPVLKDKTKPVNLHVYVRGNPEVLGEEAPRQFLAILSPGPQVPF